MENNKNSTTVDFTTVDTATLLKNWATRTVVPISTYYCDTDSVFMQSNLSFLVNFMTEEEIDKVLHIISLRLKCARDEDNPNFKNAVSEIVRSRHFSEGFLMKYSSYASKDDVLKYHSGDIQSGEYSKLGLYYVVSE